MPRNEPLEPAGPVTECVQALLAPPLCSSYVALLALLLRNASQVNAIYAKYFPENPPARATFAVKTLPLNAKVEIEATAFLG